MNGLKERVAMITGASRGIGRGIAEAFAGGGADLCLISQKSSMNDTLEACQSKGIRAQAHMGDISDPDFVKNVVVKTKDTFGGIDILVNNAGITRDGLLLRLKDSDFDEVINTNLKGAFYCMRAVAKIMLKKRWGRIINISSVVGQTGNAGQVNYAASKAGLIGMTKSAARELAGRNITVNSLALGYINTDMTAELPEETKNKLLESIPAGRFGTVEDVGQAALFLASDEAGYITGQTLNVNGGMLM